MRANALYESCSKTSDDYIVPTGFALVRPPGHHACPARPMGFCIVNNAAVATRYVQQTYGDVVKRVAIIDFDVHHGNGTQDVFYNDDSVLFVSTHMSGGFPGTGKIDQRWCLPQDDRRDAMGAPGTRSSPVCASVCLYVCMREPCFRAVVGGNGLRFRQGVGAMTT